MNTPQEVHHGFNSMGQSASSSSQISPYHWLRTAQPSLHSSSFHSFDPRTINQEPFINDWLNLVSEQQPIHSCQHGKEIPELRASLSRSLFLLSSLRALHSELSSCREFDHSQWRQLFATVVTFKSEVEAILTHLQDSERAYVIFKKVHRVKSQRAHRKRVQCKRKKIRKERVSCACRNSEMWLNEKREYELKNKTEKEVQSSAKVVLEEVKRKQSEVKQYQEQLTALHVLRKHRIENRNKGDVMPVGYDSMYSDRFTELNSLLSQQAESYEKEEHTLRVLMMEELKEKMSIASHINRDHSNMGTTSGNDSQLLGLQNQEIRSGWQRYQHSEGIPLPLDSSPPITPAAGWTKFLDTD